MLNHVTPLSESPNLGVALGTPTRGHTEIEVVMKQKHGLQQSGTHGVGLSWNSRPGPTGGMCLSKMYSPVQLAMWT